MIVLIKHVIIFRHTKGGHYLGTTLADRQGKIERKFAYQNIDVEL